MRYEKLFEGDFPQKNLENTTIDFKRKVETAVVRIALTL